MLRLHLRQLSRTLRRHRSPLSLHLPLVNLLCSSKTSSHKAKLKTTKSTTIQHPPFLPLPRRARLAPAQLLVRLGLELKKRQEAKQQHQMKKTLTLTTHQSLNTAIACAARTATW